MSLMRFWPTEQHVLDCIKPEAENPLDAVFLAVHQPMQLKRRNFGDDRTKDGTEHDLLDDFLRHDLPTGTLLMPILGNSGIGKSHLVRWLDVQLRQRSDRDNRHVIRIPKSSSLKSVLKRILDGLEGSQYDEIRRQIQSAREQMTSIQATERVRAELITAIRQRTEQAKERKARARETGGAVDPADELWIGHGDQRYLPALLSDPITSRIFMEEHDGESGTIARLARHLTEDRAADTTPFLEFSESDFDIPKSLENSIKEAAQPAQQYLRRLNHANGQARSQATGLLNEIKDDAVRPLATPADTSLSDLFYSVRKQLLSEGRELILLVEDFAVLTGIQGALYDAMIREGIRGEREACVMRTALAVTEGYYNKYDTVFTRSKHAAWYIAEIPDESEDHTINRICDFSGAYLNAARFGAEELQNRCKPDAHDHSWVPDFVDDQSLTNEETEQLDAFGHSTNGRALFPLNRDAIGEIAMWKMRDQDNHLRFNPRMIINDLLIPVLREYRQLHERGDFPPDWFLSYDPTDMEPEVRSQIAERFRNAQEQKRLCALVRFWGGNPDDLSSLQISKPVYEAFGLPVLDGGRSSAPTVPEPPAESPTPPQPQPEVSQVEETKDQPPEPEPTEITEWFDRLRVWSQGQHLIQRHALQLRSMIADAVTAAIDWDAELLRPLRSAESSYLKDWVFLPSARGASQCDPSNAFVVVATQEDFDDPDQQLRLIQALRAVVRFHHYKTWDYDRADDDFPRYANLIDVLMQQAIRWINKSYRKVDGNPIPALCESLLIGARMLDVDSAHAREDTALLDAMFASCKRPNEGESSWEQVRVDCFECRANLTEELLARTGVRQGVTGKHVYAVDAARILESIKKFKSTWKPESPFPKHRSGEESVSRIENHVKSLTRQLDTAVQNRRNEILSQARLIDTELGADFDKQAIVNEVNKVIETTKQFGVKDPQDNLSQLSKLVEEFRDAAITKCLQHASRIGEETEGGALLSALAQIDQDTLALLSRFVTEVTDFLDRTKTRVEAELSVLGTDIVPNAVEEVDSRLRRIEQGIISIQQRAAK